MKRFLFLIAVVLFAGCGAANPYELDEDVQGFCIHEGNWGCRGDALYICKCEGPVCTWQLREGVVCAELH